MMLEQQHVYTRIYITCILGVHKEPFPLLRDNVVQ